MELENEVMKASEDIHGGEEKRLVPVVEAASLADQKDNVLEESEAEHASGASPGLQAAEDQQGLNLSTATLLDLVPTCSLVELGVKLGKQRLWNGQKLTGKAQISPKNHLGSGEANPLLGSGPEPKQDPGQLLVPRTINTAGSEGVLHGAVEPLDHPITLGVVGSGLVMGDAQDSTEALSERRNELKSMIEG